VLGVSNLKESLFTSRTRADSMPGAPGFGRERTQCRELLALEMEATIKKRFSVSLSGV